MKHLTLLSLILSVLFFSCGKNTSEQKEEKAEQDSILVIEAEEEIPVVKSEIRKHLSFFDKIRPNRALRDPNKLHIAAGRELGLENAFRKNADFLAVRDSILENGILHYVEDDTYFKKKKMYHSYPYLTKEAIDLLKELSYQFDYQVKQKKIKGEYMLQLTSCLRTLQSQEKLRSSNFNATMDTTSHAFGASFDISYWEFYRKDDGKICRHKVLQNALEKAVKAIHNEKKCLVIKETGQFCFHFTAIQ